MRPQSYSSRNGTSAMPICLFRPFLICWTKGAQSCWQTLHLKSCLTKRKNRPSSFCGFAHAIAELLHSFEQYFWFPWRSVFSAHQTHLRNPSSFMTDKLDKFTRRSRWDFVSSSIMGFEDFLYMLPLDDPHISDQIFAILPHRAWFLSNRKP